MIKSAWIAALTMGAGCFAVAKDKPNILLIVADDLGYADVGFHGCRDIPTPHLDRLAASGVRFTNGYVSHSFCGPSRAGLLTGRYQQRFGYENNPKYLPDDDGVGLPVDEITIAQALKGAGYATGIVGKWHQGAAPRFHPMKRGFDEFFGFLGGGHQYFPEMWNGTTEYTTPLEKNGAAVGETEYLTDALGREAADFVRRRAGTTPFFLYLAFNAPHTPMQAPEEDLNRFSGIADPKRRVYAAMVNVMDRAIGRVMEAVRKAGTESNTMVFFFSDNGGPTTVNASNNEPLKGNKGQTFEGGIRVPFILSWPAVIEGGRVYDPPVIALDVFPTAMATAGATVPADRAIDGVDLVPYLLGRQSGLPHEILFWRQSGSRPWAVRRGHDKVMSIMETAVQPHRYDLASDIGEMDNLFREGGPLELELFARFEEWSQGLMAPRWEGLRSGRQKKTSKKDE